MSKILLVKPFRPVFTTVTGKELPFPIGLGYLAAILGSFHEILIVDRDIEAIDDISFKKIVKDFCPDIVSISNMFTENRQTAHEVSKLVAEVDPNITIIMGGCHASTMPELVLKEDPYTDFVVIGEGEDTITKLVDCLEHNKNFKSLPGIAFRNKEGIQINPRAPLIADINKIPYPAYDLFKMKTYTCSARKYFTTPKLFPVIQMVTSRGCPFSCFFCAAHKVFGRCYRTRTAENVLNEIKMLQDRFGIREFQFYDDNFTLNRERVMHLLRGLKKMKFNGTWLPLNLSIFSLDEEMIALMKATGCYRLILAIESGSDKVLREVINKPLTTKQVRKTVEIARKYDFELVGFFVIGLPGETKEDIQMTVDFAEELELDYFIFSIATPYPGSRLYEVCREKEYLVKDFSLDKLSVHRGLIRTPEFEPEELENIRQNEWKRIIFSSKKKIERLKKMTGMNDEEIKRWRDGELKF
jgi:radical SAM superfamily enzyme YgiQ (UPF0313 family)